MSHELLVFDIQRFCVHDGPGIRTTIFCKGCPLRCAWCHNPEGLSACPQLRYEADKCIGCGLCAPACFAGVHRNDDQFHTVNFEACQVCGVCAQICPGKALTITGRSYTPQKLAGLCARDSAYYAEGGGVTFSGGEPLLQAPALALALQACKAAVFHTAVDTSGFTEWKNIELILQDTDLFLYDLKAVDDKIHKKHTGKSNRIILENLMRLGESGKKIWIRIPLIPGVNDSPQEAQRMVSFLRDIKGIERVTVIPYHKLGKKKYEQLGANGSFDPGSGRTGARKELIDLLNASGLKSQVKEEKNEQN